MNVLTSYLMCIPPCRLAKKGRKQVASCFNSDEDGTSSGVSFSLCGADPDEVGSTDSDAAENACPEPSGRRRPAAAARQPVNRRVPPKLKSAGAGVQKGRQNFVRMDKKVQRVSGLVTPDSADVTISHPVTSPHLDAGRQRQVWVQEQGWDEEEAGWQRAFWPPICSKVSQQIKHGSVSTTRINNPNQFIVPLTFL